MKKIRPQGLAGMPMLFAVLWAALTGLRATADTQTIPLAAGWNLITVQVSPVDPSPSAVFGGLGAAFERVFSYDAASAAWTTFSRNPGDGAVSTLPQIGAIAPGRAYWLYMNQAVPAWSVAGTVPATNAAVNFSPGWNMIGIPAGSGALPEPVNILSVLAASGLNYDTVLKWEQGLYAKFTPADGDVDDFTLFDPNRGYWVNVKGSSFSLQPKLLASVRADADVVPAGNYPSYEDTVISHSPTPLNGTDQTDIRFFPGEESQTLSLANTGGGIMLWQVYTTNAPWLQLSAAKGVTTIENDVITLSLDRQAMPRGHYETTLFLVTSAGNRSWKVTADVPGFAGDWRGSAVISSVNGRKNPVPDIDLQVAFFEDASGAGALRGMIDSQNAVLWPMDVSLIGNINSDNAFHLGGGFVLAPGDVNRAPFSQFNPMAEDIDWNCNGKFDAVNPYPFPIYRQVSLNGQLVSASTADGYVITGDYSETVFGMLRQPIVLRGRFTLIRENPVPFSNRHIVPNQESALGNQPVVQKQITSTQSIPVGSSGATVSVVTDLQLQSLSVQLDISAVPPADLKISLLTPSGQTLVLHDHAAFASLSGLSFPDTRKPKDDFGAYLASGASTKGNWSLVIQNTGATLGRLNGFGVTLKGQPVFTLNGSVMGPAAQTTNIVGLPAAVFLDGLPYNAATFADSNGQFKFTRIPGIPLNVSASLGGYGPANPASPGLASVFTTPQYNMNCISPAAAALASRFQPLPVTPVPGAAVDGFSTAGTGANPYVLNMSYVGSPLLQTRVGLVALPFTGPAPLPVDFVVITESQYDGSAPLTYSFGDGSTNEVASSLYRSHTYAVSSPTGYVAAISVPIQGQPDFRLPTQVYPMPSPGNSPYALNFFSVAFSAGGTLPDSEISFIMGTNDVTQPPALATLLQVQQAYTANIDIDLAPKAPPGTRFDADGFDPLGTISDPANGAGNFRGEDYTYAVAQGADPGDWLHAADCGVALPSDTHRLYPGPGQTGDCAGPRYTALCNIGPLFLPATAEEVYPVPATPVPIFPSNPDPLGAKDSSGIGAAGKLRLITGPLAGFWNDGGAL